MLRLNFWFWRPLCWFSGIWVAQWRTFVGAALLEHSRQAGFLHVVAKNEPAKTLHGFSSVEFSHHDDRIAFKVVRLWNFCQVSNYLEVCQPLCLSKRDHFDVVSPLQRALEAKSSEIESTNLVLISLSFLSLVFFLMFGQGLALAVLFTLFVLFIHIFVNDLQV